MSNIATVSLAQPLLDIAGALGDSFSEYGFAVVKDHGIDARLIASAGRLSHEFFALPEEVKRKYHIAGGGGARGYTPFGTERAKGASVHDLKEFWHIGRTLPESHELAKYMRPNIWPAEIAQFREVFEALYAAFDDTGRRVLSAIALHLGLEENYFDATVKDGNSVMRLLHYPPLQDKAAEGAIRAAAHGDINTITLLLGADEGGLELLTKQGEWIAVEVPAGGLVINIGDMLDRLTNSYLRSTTHRVVNPRGEAAYRSRYSMPFFLHFRPDYTISPFANMGEGEPQAPISSHEFLLQRLREINLA